MNNMKTTRRQFIKNTAALSIGAVAAPIIFPSCSNYKGANDIINIGHIGVGSRGSFEIKNYFLPHDGTRSAAVCDVKGQMVDAAAKYINSYYKKEKKLDGFKCAKYMNYEELLENKEIDAVHIVTGDYWHIQIAIQAMKAGKHVYLAKPLGLSFPLMKKLEKTMKETGMIFHYGTQQRSFDHIIRGIDMIRNGKIGKIERIEVWSPDKAGDQVKETTGEPIPDDFNYDKWLGPAPEKPYSKERCSVRGTWFINDYSIGWLAGWGAHPLDIAIMGAKDLLEGAYTLKGEGYFWPQDGLFDTVISWDTNLEYDNGMNMRFLSADRAQQVVEKHRDYDATDGTTFFGEKGWISLSRWTARASDPKINTILNSFPKDSKGRIESENNMHGANFAKVIKGQMPQFDPLDEAIMSDCISHMGDIAIRTGKEVNWDPVKGNNYQPARGYVLI